MCFSSTKIADKQTKKELEESTPVMWVDNNATREMLNNN